MAISLPFYNASTNRIEPEYTRGAHAPLSPSAAKRWMKCPGSVDLCAKAPDRTSEPAEEGSAAHELGAICLDNDLLPSDFLGMTILSPTGMEFSITTEWVEALTIYVKALRESEAKGGELYVERGFVLYPDLCFGTADAVLVFNDRIEVWDLKFGQGEEVDPEMNEQELIYALGAIKEVSPNARLSLPVSLIIVQPRHFKDKKVKPFETTYGTLLAWEEFSLIPAIDRYKASPKLYKVGECQWCDGAINCPILEQEAKALSDTDAPMLAADFPTEVDQFSPEQLAAAIDLESAFKKWTKTVQAKFDAAKARSRQEMELGHTIPGFKLVEGRSSRKWNDEAAVEKLAEKNDVEAYESKLRSPAQMEKAFKADGVDLKDLLKLIDNNKGVAIAPESSKKKAIPLKAETVFADVEPEMKGTKQL